MCPLKSNSRRVKVEPTLEYKTLEIKIVGHGQT